MECDFSRARAATDRFEWRERAGSTNAELRSLAESAVGQGAPLPHGTVLATLDQSAGRGRLGRDWVMPPGTGLAVSVLLRPGTIAPIELTESDASVGRPAPDWLLPWLPLLAGSAVARALQPRFRGDDTTAARRVGVKWPNDVHVRTEADAAADRPGLKLCGILSELLPSGDVIVGIGVNLFAEEWELPTERATSLLAAGVLDPAADRCETTDRVLAEIVTELLALARLLGEDPRAARIRIARDSLTLGSEVRVHLPDGTVVDGRARELDPGGALIVDRPTGSQLVVHAGDVEHLR